jgi:hypothetical protein
LSEVIGSWKIIEIRLPRTCRMSRSLRASNSVPRRRTEPLMRAGGGRRDKSRPYE